MSLATVLAATAIALAPDDFNSGWRFYRGDGNFAHASASDAAWVLVDIPHDYSSFDLPSRESDESTPVLAVRAGTWKFAIR